MKRQRKERPVAHRFDGVMELVNRLEGEAERIVRRIAVRAEQSSRELRENIEELMEQIRSDGIYSVASEKKDELRRLAEQVLVRAGEIQFGSFNRDTLIREAKKNLADLVWKFQASDLFARAKVTARQTKDQVLSVLSIPSQEEMIKLSRKIASLEQRMNRLTRKAA